MALIGVKASIGVLCHGWGIHFRIERLCRILPWVLADTVACPEASLCSIRAEFSVQVLAGAVPQVSVDSLSLINLLRNTVVAEAQTDFWVSFNLKVACVRNVSFRIQSMIDHCLIRVYCAQDRSVIDADLNRWLQYFLRNEEDEGDLIYASCADEYRSWVIIKLGQLQVVWRCVHCLFWPFHILGYVV